MDSILDIVANPKMYSFMDGYNGYNRIKVAKENKENSTFILEWGAYAYNVMPFNSCNAPITFQKIVIQPLNKS